MNILKHKLKLNKKHYYLIVLALNQLINLLLINRLIKLEKCISKFYIFLFNFKFVLIKKIFNNN